MRIGRRTLIAGGGVGVLAVAGGWAMTRPTTREDRTVAIVRAVFGDAVLPEAELRAFARAVAARGPDPSRGLLRRFVDRTLPLARRVYHGLGLRRIDDPIQFEHIEVATAFLRATNYADRAPGQPVEYLGLPDFSKPLSCANPLARFDFDD
ncbi:MAG: hypothetical protein WDN24_14705 [Sphingomonas sp.]